MRKEFITMSDYHGNDPLIEVKVMELDHGRVSLLSEVSNHVVFTTPARNGVILELSGTREHFTRMDGIRDDTPTRPGDVCLIAPRLDAEFSWTIHGARQHSVFVEFGNDLFETYAPELNIDRLEGGHLIPANYAPRRKLEVLCRLLGREAAAAHPHGKMFTDLFMRLMALEIAAGYWTVQQTLGDSAQAMDRRIHRAIEFIEAHYATDISLLEISRASGLSPTQLTALFSRFVGQTPYSYVIERRLRQAVRLLNTTDTPISQIAPEVGFSDQQHMTRMFRARLGYTPWALRREKGPAKLPGPSEML